MARLKEVKRGLAMLVLDFDKQLEPGSFEHALCHLIDQGLDLTGLLSRIRNDDGGAPAYDPAVLLKIVLLAYSRGIISSRKMEKQAQQMIQAHRQADAQPHSEDQRQARKLERLQRETEQLCQWLKDNPQDRLGTQGKPILSNRTDNEPAKMATDKGVIQGYTGVATVEPMFGSLRYNKCLSRFTLRGKTKVDGQFKLYAMMHNIEKFSGSGYAQ